MSKAPENKKIEKKQVNKEIRKNEKFTGWKSQFH